MKILKLNEWMQVDAPKYTSTVTSDMDKNAVDDSDVKNNVDGMIYLAAHCGAVLQDAYDDETSKPYKMWVPLSPETFPYLFPNVTQATFNTVQKEMKRRGLKWRVPDLEYARNHKNNFMPPDIYDDNVANVKPDFEDFFRHLDNGDFDLQDLPN